MVLFFNFFLHTTKSKKLSIKISCWIHQLHTISYQKHCMMLSIIKINLPTGYLYLKSCAQNHRHKKYNIIICSIYFTKDFVRRDNLNTIFKKNCIVIFKIINPKWNLIYPLKYIYSSVSSSFIKLIKPKSKIRKIQLYFILLSKFWHWTE